MKRKTTNSKSGAMNLCPKCNTPVPCNVNTNSCWCMQYPHILPISDKTELSCLCPTCLAKSVNSQLDTIFQQYPLAHLIKLAKPYATNGPLLEDIDYTTENGLMVFSAWYHLKRGSCCKNNCRHCPYKTNRTTNPEKIT